MTWRCSWQDYRHWPQWHKQPHPLVEYEDFDTKEAAEKCARARRKSGLTVCVSMTPLPRPGRQPRKRPAFNSEWKLAR
jgi:hypothetical protein